MFEKNKAEHKRNIKEYEDNYDKKISGIVPINKDGTNYDGMPYNLYPSSPNKIAKEMAQYQKHAPIDVHENGEVSVEFTNGATVYFRRGPDGKVVISRDNDLPAIEYKKDGKLDKVFVKNGVVHRENGPAHIARSLMGGDVDSYYKDGVLHRLDGPAVTIWNDGEEIYGSKKPSAEEFYFNGRKIPEAQFKFLRVKILEDKIRKIGVVKIPTMMARR